MDLGITMFPTDYAIDPAALAKACEERGFESLWFPEHTHIPVSRRTPYPAGGDLPEQYWHTIDLFVAMAAAATATTTLKVGSGICLVIERDPILTAKEVASVDHISGGRVLFGIGGGWNREEMQHHGTDPKTRFSLLKERVEAMRTIWTNDEAEYHGKFVDFDPIWSWPKPVQQPGPPVILGNAGEKAIDRVVDYADGWMPIGGRTDVPLADMVTDLQKRAEDRGRGHIPVTLFGARPKQEHVDKLIESGVDRAVFFIPPEPAEKTLPLLDAYATLHG